VPEAATLDAEAGCEKGVAARRVDHEAGAPPALAVFVARGHEGAVGIEADVGHPAPLDGTRPLAQRVMEQDPVELRSPDLVRERERLVP